MNGIWIRSQDKVSIIELKEKITMVNMVENDWAIILDVGNKEKNKWLGVYKSKERALEVLDEIQKAIEQNQTIMYEYIHSESTKIEYRCPQKVVYEMPKEVEHERD